MSPMASILDHALASLAKVYGLSRARMERARASSVYAEQLALLEAMEHPARQHVHLAAVMVLQAADFGRAQKEAHD